MPAYVAGPFGMELSREATVLDTNVLCARFDLSDPNHEPTIEHLELLEEMGTIIVPVAVLVETWGMLVGRNGDWPAGFELINWLSNPGGPIVFPSDTDQFEDIRKVMLELHVDFVDSLLYHLAHRISEQCDLNPRLRVATYDTRDVYKLMGTGRLKFRVYDMRSGDEIEW